MSFLKDFEHLKIQLDVIKSATNNFAAENVIGNGGFGKVYKGEIVHFRGESMVAFKRLDRKFGQGNPEFWKEIMMLFLYRHENIVSLLGFCDENNEKILVYEYMSKRSLDLYLTNDNLTWIQRLEICIGAARGLAYLHSSFGTHTRVLHRDIKSSNILLDEHWNAKISDFGLSKFGPADQQFTFLFSNAVGTIGYCDPLYAETGLLTKESDVYSFGVVLFEVLCGRYSIVNNNKLQPLTGLVRKCYKENTINEIIYDKIKDEINSNCLTEFTAIAYQCLKREREDRPLMAEIVRRLESALEYQANTRRLIDPLATNSKDNAESSEVVHTADKTKGWKLTEIVDSSDLKALRLHDPLGCSKVMRLIYTNSGSGLLALASSAVHKLWKWQRNDRNTSGKSTASIAPQLWQPKGALMANEINESKPAEDSVACIALSNNDSYVMSASGGRVSIFNMLSFKVSKKYNLHFMPPPPAATYLAFYPQDNNIVAIGMEDSTIHIHDIRIDEVKMKLKGHRKQITGLAFSQTLNSLVSAGADAQLCIWNINGWEKRKLRTIQSPPGYPSSLAGETKVQFHNDQRHLLVVHESQIAIYDYQLECLKLWSPRESLSAGISSAIYSCDGQLLFTGFSDGAVGVFDAESLRLRCRIAPSAYISSSISSNSTAYPTVIAAHPSDRNQFALGMSDGSVHVIEPTDADLKPRIVDNADKSKSWKLHEIVDCSHLKALELPDPVASSKIKVESLEHSDIVDSFDHLEVCKHDVEEMDSEEETDYEDNDDAEEMDSEEETDYEDNDDAEETSDEEEIDHNSKEPDSEEDQTDELDLVGEASSLTTADIVNSSHLKALRLPDPMATTKVMRIIYTNSGLALLALTSSAVHKLWKWKRTSGKSTASVVPQLWQPSNGALMSNDVDESKPAQESAACIVLSKNDSYVMSASGGKVSLFNIMTFKVMTTFMRPPPAVTYLALHPQDNNIIAIGMEDSSIHIYNVRFDEVKSKLINGHQKQITGLDFSQTVSSLVSAGADAQLCIWNTNGWEKRKSRTIQSPPGYPSSLAGETKVQFHIDQRHLLVVHESQIAIYDYQLECLKLWSPRESLSAGISSAIYSCNGLLLFTAFLDGAVGVFDAQNLRLRCRIAPSVYIFYSSNSTAYPTVIAAHPSDPNQFALGMSDGSVHVIEPIDADLKWGGLGAQDNSTLASSNPSNSALNSQPSETPSR